MELGAKKQPLVYVGMAADIVHHGHINIIKHAAKLGKVIVGLLSDEAINSYKRTPINGWENRKIVAESFVGVHSVVKQDTLDYTENLKKIKPDYVVHGSDWKTGTQQKVRAKVIETLSDWGGKLVEPEYTPGVSTTEIIKKCKRRKIEF